MQKSGVLEEVAQLRQVIWSGGILIRSDRQLERRALQMIQPDFEIVGIEVGVLRSLSEKIIRVLDDELIEWMAGGDQHSSRRATSATGASGALPRRGDRAGVAGEQGHVQAADVYARFERIG